MAKRGMNKMLVMGNLGNDPEMRNLPNGNAVCNISIATSESWKNAQGVMVEETEWHKVVMYGKLAEITGKLTKKGTLVSVEGKLKTEKWTDNNNVERYTTKIIANEMQVLANGADYNQNQNQNQGQYQGQQSPPPQGQQRPPMNRQNQQSPPPQGQQRPPANRQAQPSTPPDGYQQMDNGVPDNF